MVALISATVKHEITNFLTFVFLCDTLHSKAVTNMGQQREISLRERIRINLVTAMENSGLNQVQLADKLGISKGTVNNWIRGNNSPDVDMVPQICNVLNTSISSLYAPTTSEPEELPSQTKNAPSLSDEALKVAQDYTALDQPGKNVARLVIAEEGKRVQAEKQRRQVAVAESANTRYIPLYYTPAAAGLTSPAAGEDFDYIEIGQGAPQKADFAVKIDGESMEPYIRDGSIIYVNREPLENGDVGIFYLDGDMLCKQYYKDDRGNVHLLSLNRNRSDADRFISARDNDTMMTYYGRVILPRRPSISLL